MLQSGCVLVRFSGLVAFLLCAAAALAGPLDPPPGPVAPTFKTLGEVEPRVPINAANTPGDAGAMFRITQSGSYYLTAETIGNTGQHGIAIAASNVTIDLRGFTLRGVAGSQSGIVAEGFRSALIVRNGIVAQWGSHGISLGTGGPDDAAVVENVVAAANGGDGISVGSNSTVRSCSALQNTGSGITTGQACLVADATAFSNEGKGIRASKGCTVTSSVARENGSDGISVTWSGVVAGCSAVNNGAIGIYAYDGSTVTGCVARQNVGGIVLGNACTASQCSALENTAGGLGAGQGSTVQHSTARLNIGAGIAVASDSTVTACSSSANTTNGITVGDRSLVTDSSACLNGVHGISAANRCVVRDNTCGSNTGGAGVHCAGGDTRIDGNNCTINQYGVWVTVGGNIVLRNTCSGNGTNYELAAANRYGPIVDITSLGSGSVSGNSASDHSGTTHPWANLAY